MCLGKRTLAKIKFRFEIRKYISEIPSPEGGEGGSVPLGMEDLAGRASLSTFKGIMSN
jgi:hypothetical protein